VARNQHALQAALRRIVDHRCAARRRGHGSLSGGAAGHRNLADKSRWRPGRIGQRHLLGERTGSETTNPERRCGCSLKETKGRPEFS
jgi:hypothetical protein